MLLCKSPKNRITKGTTHRLKNHPWCKSIDWEAIELKKVKPPFIPKLFKSNFDPEYVKDATLVNQSTLNNTFFYEESMVSEFADFKPTLNSSLATTPLRTKAQMPVSIPKATLKSINN